MCRAVLPGASFAVGWAIAIAVAIAILGQPAKAQTLTVEPIQWPPQREALSPLLFATPSGAVSGLFAILVCNPDTVPGMPPFALTDQNGVIQRYVEPASDADLESHLGQAVRVRRDTGLILLSSQLDFTEPSREANAVAHVSRDNEQHAIRTAEFEAARSPGGTHTSTAIAPIGIVAEEIAMPSASEPIWLDEMESPGGTPTSGCNCPRCRAARGESFAPDCPECAGRPRSRRSWGDGGSDWNCSICDALFGESRAVCGASCGDSYGSACGVTCGSTCCEACEGGDRWMCVRPGIIGMAEILLLRGYDSEPDSVSSKKHETGSRYELGYMNQYGRSWRVRYFEFDHPNFDGNRYLQLEYWDLEYAGRFTLGSNWRGELGGGLRWSQVDDQGDNRYDHPLGPVMEAQLRGLCCGNLEAYGIVRQSFQFGKEERNDNYGTFAISEMQLGLEYQTCACDGNAFARAFIEAQSWQGVKGENSEDVGLFGFGFALGLTR